MAQAQNNPAIQQQGGSGLAGMLGSLKDRQPYKMQTMKVKTMDEVLEESQRRGQIEAEKQFQANQADRDRRYAQMKAVYEADRARKQAAALSAQAAREQNLVDKVSTAPGAAGEETDAAAATGAGPGAKPQIHVYIPKKKDELAKPRRLFNVREQ
jgi:hypothetical protein